MEKIVYQYRRTTLETMRAVFGIGVLILIPFFLCCIVFGIWGSSHTVGPLAGNRYFSEDIFGLLAPYLLTAIVCLIAGPILVYTGAVPREAALTSETFSYGYRGRTKTLRLAEIVRVSLISKPRWRHHYWTVAIEDSHQKRIGFPIQVKTWTSAEVGDNVFDYRAMLGDLLQRLPATAVVDESVENFVATGSFSS